MTHHATAPQGYAVNTERSGEILCNSKIIVTKSDNYTVEVEATETTKNPGNTTIVSTTKQNKK